MLISEQLRVVLLSAAALVAGLAGAVKRFRCRRRHRLWVYELRISTAAPGRLADLQALFSNRQARLGRDGIEPIFSAVCSRVPLPMVTLRYSHVA